jgi:organic radical activating enzyme
MENKFICSKPFDTIHNDTGKNYAPCCWAHPVSPNNPNTTLPLDHFDGEDFRRIRREMLIGEKTDFLYSYCQYCFNRENEIGESPRTRFYSSNFDAIKNFNADGSLIQNKNRFISVAINAFGNSCNLECYACHPASATSRTQALNKIKDNLKDNEIDLRYLNISSTERNFPFNEKNSQQFDAIVNQLVEKIDNISSIIIVGGEPMLLKSHFTLLDRLIETKKTKEISLSYTSNMTLMHLDNMKKYFDSFGRVDILWSVDALGDRNHWLRYPTDWNETTKNVFSIQSYLRKNNKGKITGSITPSLLGIPSLRKTYNWLLSRNLINKEHIIFNFLNRPKFLRTRNLPDCIKDEIKNDVRLISEYHYKDLMQPRDEHHFQLAIKYFDILDQSRGTNWRSTFPEVSKYAN